MAQMKWKSKDELFTEKQKAKAKNLGEACQEDILKGYYTTIDGSEYRVSYDREAQVNMQERWALFENDVIESITLTLHKKEDDAAIRKTVTKEQFEKVYLDGVKAKEDKISRLRDVLIPMVEQTVMERELELIQWTNQVNLPEEPSIKISNENTLGKKVQKVDQKTEGLNQDISMTRAGLLELSMMAMGL